MSEIRLSCVSSLVPGLSLREKGRLFKEWGLEGMTVYCTRDECTPAFAEELLYVPETGIDLCEFAFIDEAFGNLSSDDSEKKTKNIEMVKQAIDLCGRLGALTEIEYECGHRTDMPSYDHHDYPMPPEEKQAAFVETVRELADYAAEKKVQVLLEAVNRYEANYINRQHQALELIRRADRANTGLLCDLFHMSLDEEDLAGVLRECGPYVRHVHAGDTNRHLPGRGYMDWASVIRALKEIDFRGYIAFECTVMGDPLTEIPDAVAYMKKLIERA